MRILSSLFPEVFDHPQKGWIRFALILLALLFFYLRVAELGVKPYHHDESLYAIESWKYAEKGLYKFHPMLHGPFLFHIQAALFLILPDTPFTGRLPSMLFGLACLLVGLWGLRRYSPWIRILFFALFTVSPTLTYFQRFLGMDSVMTFLSLGLLVFAKEYVHDRKPIALWMAWAFFACMVCTKLNFLFIGFSFFTFFIIYSHFGPSSDRSESLFRVLLAELQSNSRRWLVGLGIFLVIFVSLYSSLFRNMGGVLDALYREMIPYWSHQHKIRRIRDHFHYYGPLLVIYELPLVLLLMYQAFRSYFSLPLKLRRWISSATIGIALLGSIYWNHWAGFFDKALHLDTESDFPFLVFVLVGSFVIFQNHLRQKEYEEGFLFYWFGTSLLLYSYAGEKVPWLTVHITLPLVLYSAFVLRSWLHDSRIWKVRIGLGFILSLFFVWQAFNTYRASFLLSHSPRERLVFTHTSSDIHLLMQNISILQNETSRGNDFPIQVKGQSAWPLYWYLRDMDSWFVHEIEISRSPFVIVMDWEETLPPIYRDYEPFRLKLREWWVPDKNKQNVFAWLKYFFKREIYNETGSSDILVMIDRSLLRHLTKDILSKMSNVGTGFEVSSPHHENRGFR